MEYVQLVRERMQARGNPQVAEGQMAYMRHQFEFFGLKMPIWTAIARDIFATQGLPDPADVPATVRECFADDHREMHYFGLELTQKLLKHQPPQFIDFLEELILTRSWWDTVDWINKLVGLHFKRYPALIQPVTERWMASGNIWLQRVCLIFQLPYREKTDTELLFDHIRQLSDSKEFFIQKAIGWALRQYARTDPQAVLDFVAATPLAPLSRREALKHQPTSNKELPTETKR
jgi:3-methyladenine DNA glycosylase AlkD